MGQQRIKKGDSPGGSSGTAAAGAFDPDEFVAFVKAGPKSRVGVALDNAGRGTGGDGGPREEYSARKRRDFLLRYLALAPRWQAWRLSQSERIHHLAANRNRGTLSSAEYDEWRSMSKLRQECSAVALSVEEAQAEIAQLGPESLLMRRDALQAVLTSLRTAADGAAAAGLGPEPGELLEHAQRRYADLVSALGSASWEELELMAKELT